MLSSSPGGKIQYEKVTELLDRKFPPLPSYIEPNILRKGSTLLLGGAAKVGKSFMMMEFMRSLSTGTPLFNNPELNVPEPSRVLYIDMEVGAQSNHDRLAKVMGEEDSGIWGDNLYIVNKEDALGFQLDRADGLKKARDLIIDIKPNILVLDPISFMYTGDENAARDVGKLFYNIAILKEIGKGQGLSVIFSHHFGKPPRGQYAEGWDPLDEYNFRGSSKWKDGGDTLITMKRSKKLLRDSPEAWEIKMRFLTRHGSSYPEGWAEFNWDQDLRIKWRFQDKKKMTKKGQAQLPPLIMSYPEQGNIDFKGLVK